jgi:hypothetical protein
MGRPTRKKDNTNCPYCGVEQHGLYGSGSDCISCGNYFKIGTTSGGFISLWKATGTLRYRVIRNKYKVDSARLMKFIGENKQYFQQTRIKRQTRNIVIRYASSIGMTIGKIEKFHKENGSTLSAYTIKQVLNKESNGK